MLIKTILAACLLLPLLFSSNAHAVEIDSQGQVLIFPYYTARGGNSTLLSLTNTTTDVKALKVHVLEGDNGRVVYGLNVYLGPLDVWTANLTIPPDGDGQARLISNDFSCTVPQNLRSDSTENLLSTDTLTSVPDGGRQTIDRVMEGYVRVIEMGTLPTEMGDIGRNALIAGGSPRPRNCQLIANAWNSLPPGIFRQDPQFQMQPPTGGLSGDAVIINVPGARATGYEAVALDRFYLPGSEDAPSLHSAPEALTPDLASASPALSRVLLKTDQGMQIIEDTWDDGMQAVDAILMADQVINQYAAEALISGTTEWVLTFPGKQAHVSQVDTPVPPYTSLFESDSQDIAACEDFQGFLLNRSQEQVLFSDISEVVDPPQPPRVTELCYEVNIVTINGQFSLRQDSAAQEQSGIVSDLLASRLFLNYDFIIDPGFETGWMNLAFNGDELADENIERQLINPVSGRIYRGLPVVGIAVLGAENRSLNALFGTGSPHDYQRVVLPAE